jgi:hypothetical protein
MDTDGKGTAGEKLGPSDRPSLLYKYLDRYGLDAIWNLELKLTLPDEANDPFEFTPLVKPRSESDFQAHYNLFSNVPGIPAVAYDEFRRKRSYIQISIASLQKRFQSTASKCFGILCLSSDSAGVTQWARYGANHTGLVVELNLDAEPIRTLLAHKNGRWLCKVRYCPLKKCTPVRLPQVLLANDGGRRLEKALITCASEKSLEWKVEREFRFIVPLDLRSDHKRKPLTNRRMVNGHVMYFLKLDADAIRRIIIGGRASPEFENEVRKAAKLRRIGDSQIVRARIDRQRYVVVVD